MLINSPRIAICLSTYNRAPLLREMLASLKSALRQSESAITEFVAVDNGSTDGSMGVLLEFESELTSLGVRTVLLRNDPALRPAESYERAFRAASAPYAWIFADDDLFTSDGPRLASEALQRHPGLGLISLNWQSFEGTSDNPVYGPRLRRGAGGPYASLFDLCRATGVMHLSFMSSLIVDRDAYLRGREASAGRYDDTEYPHVCIAMEQLGSRPAVAVERVAVLNRFNYREDPVERRHISLADYAERAVAGASRLAIGLLQAGAPPEIVREYKSDLVLSVRWMLLVAAVRASRPKESWISLFDLMGQAFGDLPGFRRRLAVIRAAPAPLIRWLIRRRDLLRTLHRAQNRVLRIRAAS